MLVTKGTGWWDIGFYVVLENSFDVEMLGFRADGPERILKTSLVQKGGFIIAQGQNSWMERAALGLWGAIDYKLRSWGR